MAGRGSRLRPHSITVPKPMLPVAGSPIVEQLVNEIARVVDQSIEEVAFILGDPAFSPLYRGRINESSPIPGCQSQYLPSIGTLRHRPCCDVCR